MRQDEATPNQEHPVWHTLTAAVAAQKLETDPVHGLTTDEAIRRIEREGPNEIRERGRRSVLGIAAAQFKDFMVLILVAAAVVSGFIGDTGDTIVILAIVLLNAAIGFVQDYRAERALAALKTSPPPRLPLSETVGGTLFPPRRSCRATSYCWKPGPSFPRTCVSLKPRSSRSMKQC
jgi:magnesium-transporting ATPase (P-type)